MVPSEFHVHFGAGRLGLGLVLPALHASNVPYVILQRPSRDWAELASRTNKGRISVTINGKRRCTHMLSNRFTNIEYR